MKSSRKRPSADLEEKVLPIQDDMEVFEKKKNFLRAAARVKDVIYEGRDVRERPDRAFAWAKAVQKLSRLHDVRLNGVSFKMLNPDFARPYSDEYVGEVLSRLLPNIDVALESLDVEIRIENAISGTEDFIELNNDWKDRANAYVFHIRDLVSKADILEPLRERILKRLAELQIEIDRNRTRVESITGVFLAITEAVGKGAKHLDGAVKLVERLAGALSGARTAKIENDNQPRLPPPDTLGLPDVE